VTAGTLTVLMLLIIAWVVGWFRGIGAAPPLRAGSAPPPSSLLAASAVATFLVTGAFVFATSVLVNHWYNPRYSYVPSALMVEALMTGAALLQRVPPSDACGPGPRLRSLSHLVVPWARRPPRRAPPRSRLPRPPTHAVRALACVRFPASSFPWSPSSWRLDSRVRSRSGHVLRMDRTTRLATSANTGSARPDPPRSPSRSPRGNGR